MRPQTVMGAALVLAGAVLLYLLRDPLYQFVVVILEALGIVVAVLLIAFGLALILWRRRPVWYRVEEAETRT